MHSTPETRVANKCPGTRTEFGLDEPLQHLLTSCASVLAHLDAVLAWLNPSPYSTLDNEPTYRSSMRVFNRTTK